MKTELVLSLVHLLQEGVKFWMAARINRDFKKGTKEVGDNLTEIFHDLVIFENITERNNK